MLYISGNTWQGKCGEVTELKKERPNAAEPEVKARSC